MAWNAQRYNIKIIPGPHNIIELEIMGDAVNLISRLWLKFMTKTSTDSLAICMQIVYLHFFFYKIQTVILFWCFENMNFFGRSILASFRPEVVEDRLYHLCKNWLMKLKCPLLQNMPSKKDQQNYWSFHPSEPCHLR